MTLASHIACPCTSTDSQNDGVRALQVQTHENNGTIHVCHTSCAYLDGGALQDYLGKVAAWMSSNPKEGK